MSATVDYSIKFQKRKTLAIYVLNDGAVEVRSPRGVSLRHIDQFVRERAAWVQTTRVKQLHRLRWQNPIEPGAPAWFLGDVLTLAVERGDVPAVHRSEQMLLVKSKDPASLPWLTRTLEGWYREQAQTIFSARLALLCPRFGDLAVPELRLRRMRRRWGSCSRSGRVTLNVELVKLPLALVDYVIVHELCHLFEFNHGRRFYQLLAKAMPNWKEQEVLLKQF